MDLCNNKLGNKNDITISKFFFYFQIPPLSISEMLWLCNYFDASKKGLVYYYYYCIVILFVRLIWEVLIHMLINYIITSFK